MPKYRKIYRIGLIIGRFQPFHKGHLFLIKEALKICDQIIIGVGSSNIIDEKNPWSVKKRRQVLEKVIKEEKFENKVIKIVEIPDNPDDNVWFESVIKLAGQFDIWLGNNEWNDKIFKDHSISTLKIPFWKRYLHKGTLIRELYRNNKNWKDRVPKYVVRLIGT